MRGKKTIKIKVISLNQFRGLSTVAKAQKIINFVKEDTILLLDGRLDPKEEAELIKSTMRYVDKSFPGIEIGVLYLDNEKKTFFEKIRDLLGAFLLGYKRGITIIGPANVVREIKKDPDKAILLMELRK